MLHPGMHTILFLLTASHIPPVGTKFAFNPAYTVSFYKNMTIILYMTNSMDSTLTDLSLAVLLSIPPCGELVI